MHEYPLTVEIIKTASKYAEGSNARVRKINLVIGEASGVLGDSILLYFDIISTGTPCEGAVVCVESVTPMLKCAKCGLLFRRRLFEFACQSPGCGGEGMPTDIGREFYIKSVEIGE